MTGPESSGLVARVLIRVGVDAAVTFAVLTRVFQLLAGPVTIVLIARFLSAEAQGFYYTFASLLALQTFVELGFYIVVINVASHEWADLELDASGRIIGSDTALARLVSLGRLVFRWYAVASAIFVIGVGAAGIAFFGAAPAAGVQWVGPWVALVGVTGLLLWALPFTALLEGCNQVVTIHRFRLLQAGVANGAIWTVLAFGGGLWAAVAAAAANLVSVLALLGIRYRRFFAPFLRPPGGRGLHWRTDIWPMQWRIGLSGSVAFFAFSLFNPVMFRYHGAVVAGQMGMTLAIVSAIQAVAFAWIQTRVPTFGMMIAKRRYAEMDRVWLRSSALSVSVLVLVGASFWGLLWLIGERGYPLADRLLSPVPAAFLLAAAFGMQVSQCLSAYFRAHKEEPMVILSVTVCLTIGALVFVFGRQIGPLGAAVGYAATVLFLLVPGQVWIWWRCRARWRVPAVPHAVSVTSVGTGPGTEVRPRSPI